MREREETLHLRNLHRGGLDFSRLAKGCPELRPFILVNQWGNESIDFADPAAQRLLTAALLKEYYRVDHWTLPEGALCPSIPGRADYLHCLADLLASSNGGVIPRGAQVRALDIGVGASCVYPLIGRAEYGWRFLGTEVDAGALASAQQIVDSNAGLNQEIELRLQPSLAKILGGIFQRDELFDLSLCNPPFHGSPAEAEASAKRKWSRLGKGASDGARPTLNYGGRDRELWCPGGELAFIRKLISESIPLAKRCLWFTSLVSKSDNLRPLRASLEQAKVVESKTIEMKAGQKTSRLLAWTFLSAPEREAWRARRWRAAR
jgi:23S rRNA (adenine1618-N6)-methyltransferase